MKVFGFVSAAADPCVTLQEWIDTAQRESGLENYNSMMLATVGADGRPSVRVVLLKSCDTVTGHLTFFTNYRSRKAREIEANPQVAVVMHWDKLQRQVRVEGSVERASNEVSDEYFATRPRDSQIGAWASDQSETLDAWTTLVGRVVKTATRFAGRPVARPPHWGGYVIIPRTIEFWQAARGRIHQRMVFTRDPDAPAGWTSGRLYP